MKKVIVTLSIAALLSIQAVFAAPQPTVANKKITTSFREAFTNAENVKWYSADDKTYTAKFMLGESKVTAFFDVNGTLLATHRYLQEGQLPLKVTTALPRHYPKQQVYCIVEYQVGNVTLYYITLENEKYWTTVRANAEGDLITYQRLRKA
jgi:acid phosphatase class B